ncbi:MAG TPA: hypothetical protein VH518_17450 [Tepidisphaeraceae bacterium]
MSTTGVLDPRFGTGGVVPTGFIPFDVAVDSLGRTLIAGELHGDFAIMRVNPDGTPTLGFGNNGVVTVDLGGRAFDRAQRVVVQSDGKILVAGLKVNSGGIGNPATGQFALARLTEIGTLDPSFGDGGTETVLGSLTTDGIGGLTVQSDGKILFAANSAHGDNYNFITFRLQSSGLLDGTFGDARGSGSAGYVVTDMSGHDTASAVLVQSDGNIVVGGTRFDSDEFNRDQFALARYTSLGKLDRSFDGDGIVITRMIGDSTLYSITQQPDGKILAAGSMFGGDRRSHVLIRRFNVDGGDDMTLGNNGTIFIDPVANVSSVATNIFVRGDKIVIVGMDQVAGQFSNTFAQQFLLNGKPDLSFANDGVAQFNISGGAAWPRAVLAHDGKITFAYEGGNNFGGVARFIQVIPQAFVVADGFIAKEGINDGSIRVGRDQAYDFPTRVYLNVRGTAGFLDDYGRGDGLNTPGFIVDSSGNPTTFRTEDFHNPPQAFVDIPAGKAEVTVPIHVIDDTQLEPTEQATFILFDNPYYSRNPQLHDTTVSIFDNDDARINFQPATKVPGDQSYQQDLGKVFGNRGNGLSYGWDADNTANARIRSNKRSPDFRYDTFNHMQKNGADRKWEIAVPNGLYQVTLVAGDPNATDSVYRINVEGQLALSGTPSGDVHWFSSAIDVMVTDGRLTISNAAGAVNNKIAFINIQNPDFGAQPGTVSPNTAIPLKTLSTRPPIRPLAAVTHTLFSDQRIADSVLA